MMQPLWVEMGANHKGEIAALCKLVNNAHARYHHQYRNGTYRVVSAPWKTSGKAKSELYQSLRESNGTAIYNDDNPVLCELVSGMTNGALTRRREGTLSVLRLRVMT